MCRYKYPQHRKHQLRLASQANADDVTLEHDCPMPLVLLEHERGRLNELRYQLRTLIT